MPQTLALRLAEERLEFLESHRAVTDAALTNLNLVLSDPETTKGDCSEVLALWRSKLDLLHQQRLRRLEASQALIQPRARPA